MVLLKHLILAAVSVEEVDSEGGETFEVGAEITLFTGRIRYWTISPRPCYKTHGRALKAIGPASERTAKPASDCADVCRFFIFFIRSDFVYLIVS